MKPRIKRSPFNKGYWECAGSGVIGFGRTPAAAFGAWVRTFVGTVFAIPKA